MCDPTPISSPVGGLLDTINKSNLVFISFRLLKCDGDADKDFMSSFWAEHLITQGLILQRVFQQYISSSRCNFRDRTHPVKQNIGEFIVILLCKVIVHLFVFLPIFDFIDFDYIAEKLI